MSFIINAYRFGVPYSNDYSILFDGVDEYISCGTDASLGFADTDPFTFSAWVKMDSLSSTGFIMSRMLAVSFRGYQFSVKSSGKVNFALVNTISSNDIAIDSTTALSTATWYHIVITYDGTSLASGFNIYIDGTSDTVVTLRDNLTGPVLAQTQRI